MEVGLDMRNVGSYLVGFMIDADGTDAGEETFVNNINTMERLLKSKDVDIMSRYIDGWRFRIICAPAKECSSRRVSLLDSKGKDVRRGNVIVVGIEEHGNSDMLRPLTEAEIRHIRSNLGLMHINEDDRTGYNTYCICNVEKEI